MSLFPQSIASEIQKLAPSAIIELFEFDATSIGGSVYRFHAGKNKITTDIVWAGNTYSAFPIEASGFEWNGKGQLPRPTLRVANVLGTMSSLILAFDDLVGCKVTRIRTLAKYLDAVNFPTQRNLILNTDTVTASTGTSWTANNTTAPDGNVTAGRLLATATTGVHEGTKAYSGWTVGNQYTVSGYVKLVAGGTVNGFNVQTTSTIGGQIIAAYRFDTKQVVSGNVVDVGNDWFRFYSVATPTTTASANLFIRPTVNGASSYTGDGVSGIYVWGLQIELGSALTDYQQIGASFSRNATADSTAEFARDIYYIDRKASETKEVVEFELAAALDLAGLALPRRQIIQNYCPWTYRGTECGYTGTNYFDTNDAPVGSLALDVCGKRLTSCRARFGQYAELPYGGFPAAGLLKI